MTVRAAEPAVRLFCFPFAGGGGWIYRGWQALVGDEVEICPVVLPGREGRLDEPFAVSADALIESLVRSIAIERGPYALFGHSLGAVLAFEVARRLELHAARGPELVFVCALGAPAPGHQVLATHHERSDRELLDWACGAHGGDAALDDERCALILRPLRADLALAASYRHVPEPRLDCPIVAIGGLHDASVSRAELRGWAALTHGQFQLRMIEGDHFLVLSQVQPLLRAIVTDLSSVLRAHRAAHDR